MEYIVTMTTHVPAGTPEEDVENIRASEARRARELADEGHLLRLWRPPLQPGEWRTVGLFAAADDTDLEMALASMPLRVWRSDEATPLGVHPNDPASASVAVRQLGVREFLSTFTETVPAGVPKQDEATWADGPRGGHFSSAGRVRRVRTRAGRYALSLFFSWLTTSFLESRFSKQTLCSSCV